MAAEHHEFGAEHHEFGAERLTEETCPHRPTPLPRLGSARDTACIGAAEAYPGPWGQAVGCETAKLPESIFYRYQFACKSKSVTAGLWAGGAGVPRVSRGRLGVASPPRVR